MKLLIPFLLLALGGVGVWLTEPNTTAASPQLAPSGSTVAAALGAPPLGSDVGWKPMVNSNALYQGADYEPFGHEVVLRTREWNPLADEFDESAIPVEVPFEVHFVAHSGRSDEVWVAGIARDGNTVIEHWVAERLQGQRVIERVEYALPLGEAAPPTSAAADVFGGEPYRTPTDRGTPRVDRDRVYEGTELGEPWSIAADPAQRFVLALTTAGEIWRLDLLTGLPPELLLDTSDEPDLAVMTDLYPMRHQQLGMVWVAEPVEHWEHSDRVVVLYDAENDGVFEDHASYSLAEYRQAHETPPLGWADDFVNAYE